MKFWADFMIITNIVLYHILVNLIWIEVYWSDQFHLTSSNLWQSKLSVSVSENCNKADGLFKISMRLGFVRIDGILDLTEFIGCNEGKD